MKTEKKKKNLFQTLKKVYKLLDGKQKLKFLIIIIIMMVSAVLTQVTPKTIGYLTDDILSEELISFGKIIPFLLIILFANIVNEILIVIRRIMVEDTSTSTEKKARSMVIKSLLMAPLSYFRKNMVGNIHGRLNRCLDGTVKLEKLLFMDFAPAIFNSLAAIITIFMTLPIILAMPMLLVIPIGMMIVFAQIKSQKGIRVELHENKGSMDGTMVELINGIEVIRINDNVDFEINRFDEKSEMLRNKEMKHHKTMAMFDCLKFLNEVIFTVLIIGISTFLATKGIISVGSVLTAYLCFNQLLKPLEELHRIFDELSECSVLADDYFKMVEIEPDFSYQQISEKKENKITDEILNISNMNFYYDGDSEKTILKNFNLDIPKGMFLGVVGPSGCGKSSLIKIICKLEKAYGNIILDDDNIDNLNRSDIAKIVALVPQSPFLISGSIYENVCYGMDEEVSEEQVWDALKKANMSDYVNSLPDKLDFKISEGGNNLSGGQRQRIAISRIFLRKPKILILDEATSALDNTSEKYIQNEIEKLKKEYNITIISIAHRLSTLKNCDRIIVLNNGKIVEDGKYDELIEQGGIFSDMYYGKLK